MGINITAKEILYKKRIGTSGSRAVFGIGTVGGLHLVVAASRSGGMETLGAGSHPAIARHLARQHAEDIEYSDLTKSEDLDVRFFADELPKYAELTADFRKAGGYE